MKKKWIWITAIILLVTLPLSACGGSNIDSNNTNDDQKDIEIIDTPEVPKSAGDTVVNKPMVEGKIDSLEAFTDAWTDLYAYHESTINAYTGMPIISLVVVAMPLANSLFYSLLNLDEVDGNFSGRIGFSDTEGFYNKSGDIIEFGQDNIRAEDGFTPNDLAGDRILTDGYFDVSKGYFRMNDTVMRNDKAFSRTYTEFIRSDDGAFLCLYQVSSDIDHSGNEKNYNALTFISMSKTQYNFVNAEGTDGTAGALLELREGMTVEEATQLFLESGYTISESGGIEDGVFVVK